MNTKLIYTSPECELVLIQQAKPLCQSGGLDPIIDNPDVIELDDIEWIY